MNSKSCRCPPQIMNLLLLLLLPLPLLPRTTRTCLYCVGSPRTQPAPLRLSKAGTPAGYASLRKAPSTALPGIFRRATSCTRPRHTHLAAQHRILEGSSNLYRYRPPRSKTCPSRTPTHSPLGVPMTPPTEVAKGKAHKEHRPKPHTPPSPARARTHPCCTPRRPCLMKRRTVSTSPPGSLVPSRESMPRCQQATMSSHRSMGWAPRPPQGMRTQPRRVSREGLRRRSVSLGGCWPSCTGLVEGTRLDSSILQGMAVLSPRSQPPLGK